MVRELADVQRLLKAAVAAAEHVDGFAFIKWRVARGAEMHVDADQLGFAAHTQPLVVAARGDQYGIPAVVAAIGGAHDSIGPVFVDAHDFLRL